ncbi:hypothetical protein TNCV_627741 [Trichonephila clavipes]|nr:hypothetical protein TNCV_627741 [Trichonephila clavipes]
MNTCQFILPEKCQINIKLLVKLKKSATKTFQILTEAYGDETLSRAHVFERHKRFSGGRVSVEDEMNQLGAQDEEAQAKTENLLKELSKTSFQNCSKQWQHRMQKCVNAEGNYLERDDFTKN